MLIHEIEQAWNSLIVAIAKEGVGRQVGHTARDLVGDYAASAGDRLPAALEHQRETDREPRAVGPEAGSIPARRRNWGRLGPCRRGGDAGSCDCGCRECPEGLAAIKVGRLSR
jgi:hypothetical protein